MRRFLITFLTLIFTAVMFASTAFAATEITGAGATFPYPLYSKWFSEYQKVNKEVQINYQSIGSGGGIRQFLEKTVDFGASDAPMTDEQLKKSPVTVHHIPTTLGAVVLTYNLVEVKGDLKLDGEIIADIFLGKITKWNDPRLVKLNPTLKLPDQALMVAHRSDGSGTTNIFADYLAKVSPTWKEKVGVGTALNWPVGLGGKGNEGVAGLVKQTPGSIGYVELIYAASNKLPVASVKNRAGVFVKPETKAVTAAAANFLKKTPKKDFPEDFRMSITDAEGKDSYPISSFTYLLVYGKQNGIKGSNLVKFLNWAIYDGQKLSAALEYAPLPKELVTKIDAKIKKIEVTK
ncbi:MAG: phosphate ABC transporter substrate-binding protein PstS [Oligoflexia bacterium]|nr:phosphate ABC transporter substrate-binding protein PstS [Oligoflexia bacterium]